MGLDQSVLCTDVFEVGSSLGSRFGSVGLPPEPGGGAMVAELTRRSALPKPPGPLDPGPGILAVSGSTETVKIEPGRPGFARRISAVLEPS